MVQSTISNLTSFLLLVLLLIFPPIRHSAAMEKTRSNSLSEAHSTTGRGKVEKEYFYDDDDHVAFGMDGVGKAGWLAGRRIVMTMMRGNRRGLKEKDGGDLKKSTTTGGESPENISGAGGVDNIGERKLSSSKYNKAGGSEVKSLRDFTAFSADYHVPRSHPPKNN